MTDTHIPAWPESERRLPLMLSQTSIATVTKKHVDDMLKAVQLHNMDGKTVVYSGPRFGIDDLEVLMAVVHLCRGMPIPDTEQEYVALGTSVGELLDVLEWPNFDDNYKRLEACLKRLQLGQFDFKQRKLKRLETHFFGALLGLVTFHNHATDGRKRGATIQISKSALGLWTTLVRMDWRIRRKLKLGLSRWIQSFVICETGSSRQYEIHDLHRMCGATNAMKEFRRQLRAACEELKLHSWLDSYAVMEDSAMFKRSFDKPGDQFDTVGPAVQMRLDWLGDAS